MNKILILFAHPRFEKSKTNRALLDQYRANQGVTLNDLYEQYPDFNIDVDREKELLLTHQVIIWHHPFYMYSSPALLKQWIDLVLEHGWAHGKNGDNLKNKIIFNVITSGGTREVYAANAHNRFTIREFLVPFEQTATLCKMIYLPPFAVQGTYLLSAEALKYHVTMYHTLLERLAKDDFDVEALKKVEFLNDWLIKGDGGVQIMISTFLHDALIYLAAAVVFVPVSKKLGMGSVLGYLLGGIIIGPFVLGFVGQEGKDIMHFAEFGVVMMLFLIGLELEPSNFWRMRNLILGTGSLQLFATTILIFALLFFMGFTWQAALASGLALAMSSTAIVMQTLREKGLTKTESGKSSFAVLLFQDISVIPILALLPLLALSGAQVGSGEHASFLSGLPGWAQTLTLLVAVNLVVICGRFMVVPFLRFIARIHLRELFTAAALLIIVGTASLMILVGLSPALGTFLAGVVLANSEFRHELESDIEPFKGILLGLFFISVGASINFNLIISNPLTDNCSGSVQSSSSKPVCFFLADRW